MTSELSVDIKSISIQAIENSLLSHSSLLSELREFGQEIASITGYTEEESKKRVLFTFVRISSCFEYLYRNFELNLESLKKYSDTVLQLTDIVKNEWGFVPETIKKDVKKNINNLCTLFNNFKPIKSYLPLKSKIDYIFNFEVRIIIDNCQKELNNVNRNLIDLRTVIDEADSKPLLEVTRCNVEEFDENYSALADGVIKSYERMPEEAQKRISDEIVRDIIDYVKEINPDDETIKELEEQVKLSQEIEQNYKKQSIPCQSKTFKSLIQQVQPVSSDFDSQKAKEDYLNQKYNL